MSKATKAQPKAATLGAYRVRRFGDPALKGRCPEVTSFDERLVALAEAMFRIMDEEDGVGLAAPQIGVQKRLAVWCHPETGERYVLVNPRFVEMSESTTVEAEGCLSVPGYAVDIPRADRVVVECENVEGTTTRVELEGLLARIVQHETDHLDGVLILDRTTPEERRRVLKEMREQALTQ